MECLHFISILQSLYIFCLCSIHITLQKIAIIELGSCSMRAGVLTMEPSLPQSFFPTVVLVKDDGKFIVGGDAFIPEVC